MELTTEKLVRKRKSYLGVPKITYLQTRCRASIQQSVFQL